MSLSLIAARIDLVGFCRNNNTSSAKRLILWVVLGVVIPVILSFCCIAAANGSINNANNEGENGHPCLVPLWSVIGCDVIPLVVTAALGEL